MRLWSALRRLVNRWSGPSALLFLILVTPLTVILVAIPISIERQTPLSDGQSLVAEILRDEGVTLVCTDQFRALEKALLRLPEPKLEPEELLLYYIHRLAGELNRRAAVYQGTSRAHCEPVFQLVLAGTYGVIEDEDKAIEYGELGLKGLHSSDYFNRRRAMRHRLLFRAHSILSSLYGNHGNSELAEQHVRQATKYGAQFRPNADTDRWLSSLWELVALRAETNEKKTSRLQTALFFAERSGHPYSIASVLESLGIIGLDEEDPEAIPRLERAREIYAWMGAVHFVERVDSLLARGAVPFPDGSYYEVPQPPLEGK